MIGQKKRHSILEVVVNTSVGYVVSFFTNMFALPLFGVSVSTSQNLKLGVIFTLISIIRSYVLRRIFNRLHAFGK